uniref:C2 domain-containing protein n=1 Tax=Hucho hucho TaxID=62062 RepID=A0A4W5QC87_9TELE
MTSQCCTQEKGQARLTVTVKNAKGLLGDTTSQSVSYTKVLIGKEAKQTNVIYNNDNPVWNSFFGFVKLSLASELKFERPPGGVQSPAHLSGFSRQHVSHESWKPVLFLQGRLCPRTWGLHLW